MILKLICLISIFGLVLCTDEFRIDDDCASNEKCVDEKLYDAVDRIDSAESLPLFGGLEIVNVPSKAVQQRRSRDMDLWEWLQYYFETHTVNFIEENFVSYESEGARTKKLKKFIFPLLLIMKLKMAMIIPTILSVITLIAVKGFMAGIAAIILSSITALKVFGQGNKSDRVTAIVAPIPSDILKHHSDYGNRWSRIGQDSSASSPQTILSQAVNPTANYLTQAYAPDPALDPYSAYNPYPTVINAS